MTGRSGRGAENRRYANRETALMFPIVSSSCVPSSPNAAVNQDLTSHSLSSSRWGSHAIRRALHFGEVLQASAGDDADVGDEAVAPTQHAAQYGGPASSRRDVMAHDIIPSDRRAGLSMLDGSGRANLTIGLSALSE